MNLHSNLIRLLFILTLLISIRAGAQGLNDCDFYLRQSKAMGCAPSDYLVKFGYKYCKKFKSIQNQFSPEGLKTLERIRYCLINELDRTPGLLCSNMKSVALQSHVRCYKIGGYCNMAQQDRDLIKKTVWKEMFDPEFASTAFKVESSCNQH